MLRMPDNPQLVNTDYLQRLDAETPGRWIAQPKLDGWRRVAWRDDTGHWHYLAKHHSGPAAKPLPIDLQAAFEGIHWPEGIALDMEWMGPRNQGPGTKNQEHSLHVFDLLMAPQANAGGGGWLGGLAFSNRYALLEDLMQNRATDRVKLVPIQRNPGLVDFFLQQMQDPNSEGLVIRRSDSGLVGNLGRGANNPHWFKVKYREAKEQP